jgi:drug/metabolite transporter (DMT)-like permease
MTYLIALICVLGIAAGQILFKFSAVEFNRTGSLLSTSAVIYFITAMVLYGTTTIGWVWLLQKIDLGKIYPFMALSFVLVPLASHLLLGERFQAQYFIGVAIIILGIVISVRA